jgi:ABC-type uncharacterized transport system involved in gliding motility auxiliary subunit
MTGKGMIKGLWWQRRRRYVSGLNTGLAILLALVALVLVNYLSLRYFGQRWDIGTYKTATLSDKTQTLLAGLKGELRVVVFFQRDHESYADVVNLLRQYEYEAGKVDALYFSLEIVDPHRDLARAGELARIYDVQEPNVIVLDYETRRQILEAKDLVDYDITLRDGKVVQKMTGFKAEEAISSAIQMLSQTVRPAVYFLAGHGEPAIDSTASRGYAAVARALRRDNIDVAPLLLNRAQGMPTNCAALVIAGPRTPLSSVESDVIKEYLARGGRLLCLLNPAVDSGLEGLFEQWGVKVGQDRVFGLSLTGRELLVTDYGDHPITRKFKNTSIMLFAPRSVQPVDRAGVAISADRPNVMVLAATSADGWANVNVAENPAKFDPQEDRKGPVSVAVAVEKGGDAVGVEVKSTRMVITGDSDMVANSALNMGLGANLDFFINSLNWLLEREALIGIASRSPLILQLGLNEQQSQALILKLVLGLPAVVAVVGLMVWWRRRA